MPPKPPFPSVREGPLTIDRGFHLGQDVEPQLELVWIPAIELLCGETEGRKALLGGGSVAAPPGVAPIPASEVANSAVEITLAARCRPFAGAENRRLA
jgi:hypothetical protein